MRPGKTLARPQFFYDHIPLQGTDHVFTIPQATADHRQRRASLMAIAAQPWQMLADLMLRRQTRSALSTLNDYLLKDIGISRGEIEHISRNATPARFTRFGNDAPSAILLSSGQRHRAGWNEPRDLHGAGRPQPRADDLLIGWVTMS